MPTHPTRTADPHPTASAADAAATAGAESLAPAPQPTRAGDRYVFVAEVARGGMGEVYRATDTAFGREVAVKVLQMRYAPDSGTARRFADEARITAQLQHPNIPAVFDLGTLPDGRPFLAMKLIKGETLDELLKHRADPTVERGRFVAAFEQVCQAVGYAHAHNVIHRDLKPANIMVGAFGEVQVMDWGLAKVLGRANPADAGDPDVTATGTAVSSLRDSDGTFTQAGAVLGTPAFMPPEQAIGAIDQIDARSDVFGLGGILAAILTGAPPFLGETAESTRQMAARGRVEDCFARLDACGADPVLVALAKRCLALEKSTRPADAGQVAREVAALRVAADERLRRAEDERLAAEVRATEQAKRRRAVQRVGAGVVAVLLLGVTGTTVGLVRADAARRKEEAARARAETNYARSLRAADALSEELARGIRPIAGTQSKTVIEILDRAKQISDDLLTDPDAPPEALERKARMLVQFTELYRETNRTVPARHSAEQAIALFDQLLADKPDDRSLRIERAKAQNRLGWVLFDQGHLPECLAALRGCAAGLEAAGAEADPVLAATFLASAYTYQANVLVLYGNLDAAESMYKRGLDIRRKAVAAAGDNTAVRMQLGLSLEKYGVFLARYRSARKDEGQRLLREGRTQFEAMCKANPSDASLHLQLVRILTNLSEFTYQAEAASCVEVAEKITERFVRRDPDHIVWQREDLRVAYERIAHKLQNATRLDPAVRTELRRAQRKMLEDILAVIVRRNAQDPENYLWLLDLANMKAQLADSSVRLAQLEPEGAGAHLAKARELSRESLKHYEPLRARSPTSAEVERDLCYALRISWDVEKVAAARPAAPAATPLGFALHYAWKSERERALQPAVLVARWEHDARKTAMVNRLVAANPAEKYWEVEFRRAYFLLEGHWKTATEKPDWQVLGRPEVIRAMLGVATVFADVPDGIPNDLRGAVESVRTRVGATLRAFDAKGLLPPDGKKLLDRFPPPK